MPTTIAISQFKSYCLEIIEKLQVNRQSVIITKRDKAIAKVLPIETKKCHYLACLKIKRR